MNMHTSYEKKETYLRELKAELKEAEAEIIRLKNEMEVRFKEKDKELNEEIDNLNRKVDEVKTHIRELEEAGSENYEKVLEMVTKSWNGLVAMLNKAELLLEEKSGKE